MYAKNGMDIHDYKMKIKKAIELQIMSYQYDE